MNKDDLLKRIDELLVANPVAAETLSDSAHVSQACVSLLALVYGRNSPQLQRFNTSLAEISEAGGVVSWRAKQILVSAQGALRNLKHEIQSGLTGNLRQQITGEVLTDLVQLARSALNEQSNGAKNVAAVLTAAAFEDTIRRMGEELAGVIGQDDLSDVLKKLKDTGMIQSPQVGIAQSYLNFRNHALHANWDNIERESIQSVLGFVEQLLLKHFA
jgi:hypothetical protein